LNRKKRIFRSGSRALTLPSARVLFAGAGAAATGLAIAFMLIHSSDAPAQAPANGHVAARADALAVLDGETMRVGEQVVRLSGIAAPARGSVCHGGARDVDCGAAAANALAYLVRGSTVDCTINGHDSGGRPVADCVASGVELNEALVRDGWAHAQAVSLRHSEDAARAAGRGIWRPLSGS
jgi:endonuclease YncB( thermonuclease family)